MGTELVPETSCILNHLTWLEARESFIAKCDVYTVLWVGKTFPFKLFHEVCYDMHCMAGGQRHGYLAVCKVS
jgi:hypothetical protein